MASKKSCISATMRAYKSTSKGAHCLPQSASGKIGNPGPAEVSGSWLTELAGPRDGTRRSFNLRVQHFSLLIPEWRICASQRSGQASCSYRVGDCISCLIWHQELAVLCSTLKASAGAAAVRRILPLPAPCSLHEETSHPIKVTRKSQPMEG